MSYKLTQAIDAAIVFLGAKKLCNACEDDKAFYITACGDNGEPILAATSCRVDKETLAVRMFYHDDPDRKTPKTQLEFPEERRDIYIPWEKVVGLRP